MARFPASKNTYYHCADAPRAIPLHAAPIGMANGSSPLPSDLAVRGCLLRAFADDDEWRPIARMGVLRVALVDECEHRPAQCLRAAKCPVARDLVDGRGDQL